MVKYPNGYAGHSYVITKSGAQKLLDNNKCVRFAADVNIHMSDVNLYCTPVSYFIQKMGNMKKELVSKLMNDFQNTLVYNQRGWDVNEIASGTLTGDDAGVNSATISDKIELDSVDWKPFQWKGDVIEGWTNIHLKL